MRTGRLLRHNTLLVAMVIALVGCDDIPPEQPSPPPTAVAVISLDPVQLDLTEDLPGRVSPVRVAEIRPQVSGIVQRRLFEQGAEIQAGDPLFQINPAPFKADAEMAAAALQRAEAAFARAQVQARRLEPLMKAEAISRQSYDDAVSQRDQAEADVALARATLTRRQLDLEFSTVDAPISGRIDQALVTEGALVSLTDSTPMARIQQVDQVYVDLRLPAGLLDAMRQTLAAQQAESDSGLPVTLLRGDGTAYESEGRILFSGINVDAGTGDVLLRILVDNAQRDLLPGMFVRARVPRASYAAALMIPQQAVSRIGGKPHVWVVGDGDHVQSLPVVLGELVEHRYRIREGLKDGQRVVVEGAERLSEGAIVAPRDWHPQNTATR